MAAQLAAPPAPARARTNFHSVAGDSQRWGATHDSPLVTALPFIEGPPQYAHRNMMLGHAEKRELARHMLPDADEVSAFEVDHTIGPPAVDAWLHASWRRSRLVVGGTRCALSQTLQSALPTPRRAR